MNWLAHLYLAAPDPAARIGNLLPDFVSAAGDLAGLPAAFQPGIAEHQRIDRFTDSHPVVRGALQRIVPPYRRFGGILVDLFFDYFLARDWPRYCTEPLPTFVGTFYRSLDPFRTELPPVIFARLEDLRAADWLCSYGDHAGIARALARISARFKRPIDLAPAISVLKQQEAALAVDFETFFPDLQAHVATHRRL